LDISIQAPESQGFFKIKCGEEKISVQESSTGLAADIKALTNALNETNSTTSSKENIKSLTDSISQRCSDAGVDQLGN
jgi:hypothetical protein